MAITDGKIEITDADNNSIEVNMPVFPYKSIIDLPFDIQKLDDGTYGAYDHGADHDTYDIRRCQCRLMLTPAEQVTLNDFLREDNIAITKGRAYDVTLKMNAGSGFFPFCPDKGDVGDFDVAIIFRRHGTIGESPFKYFVSDIEIVNTGSWPEYSLPAEISEGSITIGTITNNRFPPDWFKPKVQYGYFITIEQDSSVQWIDRSENGDWWETFFRMHSNESKAAKVIEYLTGTARANAFNMTANADSYMFGRDKGNGIFSTQLIQDSIIVTHEKYNLFTYSLNLSYVSGPS